MSEISTSKSKLFTVVIGVWIGVCLGALALGVWAFKDASPFSGIGGLGSGDFTSESNMPVPDFELENSSGQPIRISDLRGQVVVVNFWATWCVPCVDEMPMFQKYQELFPGFIMLGVDEEESAEVVHEFIDEHGFDYEILMDTNARVAALFKVMMLPSTYFIDEGGIIRFQHIGYMGENHFRYYMDELGVLE